MKSAALLSLLTVGSASAFQSNVASNARSVAMKATVEEIEALPGVSFETGGKIFDPMNLAQWAPAEHLRKAELSNGRSAMLASVGWFFPALVGTFASDDVTTTDPLEAVLQADPQWWAQFVVFCGVIEGIKYRAELEGKSYTGDGPAAIDWAGQWDKLNAEQKEDMRLKELKNGRLAMLAVASYVSAAIIPGSVPAIH